MPRSGRSARPGATRPRTGLIAALPQPPAPGRSQSRLAGPAPPWRRNQHRPDDDDALRRPPRSARSGRSRRCPSDGAPPRLDKRCQRPVDGAIGQGRLGQPQILRGQGPGLRPQPTCHLPARPVARRGLPFRPQLVPQLRPQLGADRTWGGAQFQIGPEGNDRYVRSRSAPGAGVCASAWAGAAARQAERLRRLAGRRPGSSRG